MTQPPQISVIVPIYNTEDYLPECIDSIFCQTFTNFELILVNDGSPDACSKICDEAKKKDNRVHVIHQENLGVTRARANGVDTASGDFICFVDSDDTLLPHALQTLINAVTDETDIIIGDVIPAYYATSAHYVSISEYRKQCVVMDGIHPGPYAKLFRRTLFDNEVFNIPREIRVGEDAIMNIRIAYKVDGKIYQTGNPIYSIRNNATSVTHTFLPSPETVMMFGKFLLASFPPEDLHIHVKAGLYKKLMAHWLNALHHTPTLPPSVREYRRFLLSHKKESGFKFNLYSYILFHCPNQTCLTLFIWLWKKLSWLNKLRFYKLNKATIS